MAAAKIQAIVIGGSAGAFDVLLATLPQLPAHFAIPIAIVLHVPPAKPSYLTELLGAKCPIAVKEAEDKEALTAETVYLAPPNYHLLIERRRCFSLSVDDPVHFSRPAIDVLFESAADAYGPSLAGLLLTGANEDGARGLARIAEGGGTTLVQAPETAFARAMPEAAIKRLRPDQVLPVSELGGALQRLAEAR
jgi:two-component system chemotaxis response regulator CheB